MSPSAQNSACWKVICILFFNKDVNIAQWWNSKETEGRGDAVFEANVESFVDREENHHSSRHKKRQNK